LKNYQNIIIDILSFKIILNNKNYELKGLINIYSDDHYTLSNLNSKLNTLYVKFNKNYYNDSFHNNSKIYKEDFHLKNLKNYLRKNIIKYAIYSS